MARTVAIGHQDYETVRVNNYFYIDKTDFIREWWDSGDIVTLIARPRRFGKTLNMSMTEKFFSVDHAGRSDLFEGMKIWEEERFRELQGRYPVIFLTFAGVKDNNYPSARENICRIIEEVYNRFDFLTEGELLNEKEKRYYSEVTAYMDDSTAAVSLRNMSDYLYRYYGEKVIILLDEYDTPMQEAYVNGYWEQLASFIRSLFNYTFKTNPYLERALMTGITRVSKESIFSDLNNLKVVTSTTEMYETGFGFTEEEVFDALDEFGLGDKRGEVKSWYDGYRFGKSEIFNPWSVINYFNSGCEPKAFWLSTGSNEIIGEIIAQADQDIYKKLTSLVSGKTIVSYIDTSVIYPQIKQNPSAIYSFLLVAGYLNAVKVDSSFGDDYMCELALPNKEISFVYRKEILQKLNNIIPQATVISVQEAIYSGDGNRIQKLIHDLLLQSASSFDTVGENFYHGFMLGLCSMLSGSYTTSNRESGEGRYDIQLMPKTPSLPGILIELKAEKHCSQEKLSQLAEVALKQINDNKYELEMVTKGIRSIFKYGVAFSGKNVAVSVG